jgi:putative hydrolase of the HAD superfamily
MAIRKVQVPWADVDTLLLDMDGTLLDLAFDNFFWLELVPREFAQLRGLAAVDAKAEIERRYEQVIGTLPWYCLDHWTRELELDVRALKRTYRHLIGYLPMAREFLRAARQRNKQLILVTNAHRDTLAIKADVTAVDTWMDAVVSSHDYAAAKEESGFWVELTRRHDIDPERSILLEDSVSVLDAATSFGIGHSIAIRCPDSRAGRRDITRFAAVDGVADLV